MYIKYGLHLTLSVTILLLPCVLVVTTVDKRKTLNFVKNTSIHNLLNIEYATSVFF